MKYLVTWIIINTFLVPCDYTPKEDEYGRIPNYSSIPAVACWDTIEEEKERVFDTLEEAKAFVEKGKDQSDLKDFEIRPYFILPINDEVDQSTGITDKCYKFKSTDRIITIQEALIQNN